MVEQDFFSAHATIRGAHWDFSLQNHRSQILNVADRQNKAMHLAYCEFRRADHIPSSQGLEVGATIKRFAFLRASKNHQIAARTGVETRK